MTDTKISRRSVIEAGLAGGFALALPAHLVAAAKNTVTRPVDTTAGHVRGLRTGGISRFLGIPYGEDTSMRRFQPPLARKPWAGVRDCFEPGAKAPQGPIAISAITGTAASSPTHSPVMALLAAVVGQVGADVPESEDCLVLNVFTPDASPGHKRPVMVWLHGGGFASGVGYNPMTEGSVLAHRGDVVVVSLNHRLNAMGYLYLGALHEDFADSGNVGQLDVVLALQWVRDNIAAFGGDPGNVTIFGQSGGGRKVSTLLGTLPAQGLFHKAIPQSGPAATLGEVADAAEVAERTLATLGVSKSDVHQLQTMDRKAVIAAASAVRLPPKAGMVHRALAPIVDGRSIPAHPFDPVATAISRDVPMMIGTTKDEMTLMVAPDPNFGKLTPEQVQKRFTAILGARAQAVFEHYQAVMANDSPSYWLSSMMTDLNIRNESIRMADRKAAQNAAAVYMYRVDYEPRVMDRLLRSPHGTEVPLMFGTLTPPEMIGTGAEVTALSNQMLRAWTNFARTGNPSQPSLSWPRYEISKRQTMIFDVQSKVVSNPDGANQDFWNAST